MPSIFENASLNKIFMIYGNLDDMFITPDLQSQGFRPFLNSYLKSLGYEQIVYYSGAKNVGKFVLDDESAMIAINRNKTPARRQAQAENGSAPRRRRILNPAANRAVAEPDQGAPAEGEPQGDGKNQLVYSQPKITPFEFLDDARVMMGSGDRKSAVVFTFMQDFLTESGPMQPYLELVSHLWDEYNSSSNENICVFLAPRLTCSDISRMFDRIQNGDTLKNKFFNQNGTVNRSACIEISLPNLDEIGYMLERLRIVGDGGRRLSFARSQKHRIARAMMFLSREADRSERGLGSLKAIHSAVRSFMARSDSDPVPITEECVRGIYSRYKSADEPDPLEKLRDTRGWEAVYKRINEILKDCEIKGLGAARGEKIRRQSAANERLDPPADDGRRYPIPHFVLHGNPGVGKTTVARLIGRIFYDAGILKKGITVEAKRDDLVDAYVGGTAIKTSECVMSAQEGVLFIDDAYSLLDEGSEHNYPKEAIDTLVPIMTNPDRYRFCMIMAGYPEPMDRLLAMNAGLRSRFNAANILTIEDYRPDLLREIFADACQKKGFRFQGSGEGEENPLDLDTFFTNMYNQRNRADFGNARDVIALAGEAMLQSSVRDPASRCIVRSDFGEAQKYFERRGASSIDDIYEELDGYVGLDFVKEIFKNVRLEILDARECARRGVPVEQYPDHYVFAGNPGTGKTTVGRLIGKFYHMMEVLGGEETLFADASEITGSHYGDSKDKVLRLIQSAIDRNCVLYIDEAYQIIDSGYASETIGAMMTRMTENAADFKMIFGMYSNRVEEFLALNAGLSRRLRVINFPDYNPEQLLEIFSRSVKAQGCTVTDEARDRVRSVFMRMYDVRTESFGNAGEVKKLLADMKRSRLARTEAMNPQDPLKYEYALSDIPPSALALVENLANPRSFDDIMGELNEQIGLSELKDVIMRKRDELLYARSVGEGTDGILPGYYFFVGGPGTGKSTSARLFAECLHQLGIIRTNSFHSCTAKDLIGQYVGETDKKTWNLLKKSANGALFIDEAYSLSYAGESTGSSFKKEAVEQIIAFMDDPENRKRCCIIFAGYPADMQGLYRSNAGMRSRVEEVRFLDYTAEETYEIFALFCRRNGYAVADGVRERCTAGFEKLKKLEYFANGRTARTIFERTASRMKQRVIRSANLPGELKKTILPEDLLSDEEMASEVGVF
ncbi:MAG: AAA family ATPase [Synergistaceae bacterium]|jgi:SpoVK/Ycf46/Vps4 family AAA+-type ATPase|nr:AAA family ATPase [Synergistaceae bacterium]